MDEFLKKIEELSTNFDNAIKASKEGLIEKTAFEAKVEELNKASKELFEQNKSAYAELEKKVLDIMKKQGEDITLMKSNIKNEPAQAKSIGMTFKEALEASGMTEKYTDETGMELTRLKEYGRNKGSYEVKAAIDMTTALTLLPGATPGTNIGYLTSYAMSPVKLPISQDVHLSQVFPVKMITGKYFGVVVYYTETKAAATKAENVATDKSSFLIKTVEYNVHDVALNFHLSKNNLEDIDGLLSEVEARANNNIVEVLDTKMLSTNATAATDIVGLLGAGNYTDFNPATFAGTVSKANVVDVMKKMKLQARLANKKINAFLMHPSLIDEIETLKDVNGNYPLQLGVKIDANGKVSSIAGCAIIDNVNVPYDVTTGKYLIGVNTMESAEIGLRRDITMEIGWDTDDIRKRMVTVVFYIRVAFGIKDTGTIIVSDNVGADISTINTGA